MRSLPIAALLIQTPQRAAQSLNIIRFQRGMKVKLVFVMDTMFDGIIQIVLQVNRLSLGIGVLSILGNFDRFRGRAI